MGAGASVEEAPQSAQLDNSQQIQRIVDAFVTEQVKSVARKAALPAVLSKADGSTRRLTHKASIEALAWQHQSRQTMKYISQDIFNASFRRPFSRAKEDGQTEEDLDKTVEFVKEKVPVASQALKPKLPKLSLQLVNNVDDEDWIQVDDDADLVGETPRVERRTLSVHSQSTWESYRFTQSGTIFVRGFNEGIGQTGIRSDSPKAAGSQAMPMQERLVLLGKLGQGATGVVYKAFDLQELRLVALKSIPVHDRAKRRQMSRELCALYDGLWHPDKQSTDSNAVGRENIVKFYDAFSNVEEAAVALMVEYLDGGSLQDIVDNGGCDDEEVLASISHQALLGLAFLHKDHQLHRDLKPANMLINRQGEVKIADLGIARQVGGESPEKQPPALNQSSPDEKALDRAHTFVGTVTYMSPERIDGAPYSFPSDVWSFGLSILTCALGRLPIDSSGGYWSILQSIRDDVGPRVPNDGQWSAEFEDFIHQTLKKNPDERPTCEQLLQHPFLKNTRGLLSPVALDATAIAQNGNGFTQEQHSGSDDQAMQRLVADVDALLDAVAEHIRELRSRWITARQQQQQQRTSASTTVNGTKDSTIQSVADIMQALLLGRQQQHTQNGTSENPNDASQQALEVRLQQLAHQLTVPVSTIIERCTQYIDNLRKKKDQLSTDSE